MLMLHVNMVFKCPSEIARQFCTIRNIILTGNTEPENGTHIWAVNPAQMGLALSKTIYLKSYSFRFGRQK